jgi:hypothetical protein
MKVVLTLVLASSAALGLRFFRGEGCCGFSCPEADIEPSGQYVEARTASVFAGACHYNSELVTQGREAVLAWHFEQGRIAGTSLEGVDVMVAVASPENLVQGAARRSVIYVDSDASAEQRETVVEWVKARCAGALGAVLEVETLPVDVKFDGERYAAHAGEVLSLDGGLLPDRECCKMPYDVWYEPFASIVGKVVGNTERFVWNETRLAAAFENRDRNDAFTGTFGLQMNAASESPDASCCLQPSRAAALSKAQ